MAPYLNLITGTTIQQDKDIESRIKRLEEELKEAFAKREKADEEQYEEWARTHPKEISEILKGAGGESL
jgi:restriction endonuclease S subunit